MKHVFYVCVFLLMRILTVIIGEYLKKKNLYYNCICLFKLNIGVNFLFVVCLLLLQKTHNILAVNRGKCNLVNTLNELSLTY